MSVEDTVQLLRKKYEEMETLYANELDIRSQCSDRKEQLSRMKVEAIKKYDALAGEWEIQGRLFKPIISEVSLHRRIGSYTPLDQILPDGGYGNILLLKGSLPSYDETIRLDKFSDYAIVFGCKITIAEFLSFCVGYSITPVPSEEFREDIDKDITQKEERLAGFKMLRQLLCE